MKIEIDTNKDSEEEIRHIVKMLMNLLGDNVAFQTEIAREELIKRERTPTSYSSQPNASESKDDDSDEIPGFSFLDENKEEEKQPENRIVNEPKERAKTKAKVEEE